MKKQVLFIVLMLMPLMACAQTEINGIYYNLNSTNKVASVTTLFGETEYYGAPDYYTIYHYSGKIVIPRTVDDDGITYTVTSIGNSAFENSLDLTSITIPNNVTSIGSYAFLGCSGLSSITIPNSVTSIGSWAFSGCFFSSNSFINNSTLTSNNNWGATICDRETEDGLLIKDKTIVKCRTWATSVTIPNSVTSIGNSAFNGCSGLTSVTIPNSVTSIGDFAFSGCSGLTSVTIPNSVTSIGRSAFGDCSSLTSITIPNSVTSIGDYAFFGCDKLNKVTFHCKEIGDWFSGKASINEIVIGDEVTSIDSNAFSGCSGLTSVTIPNSVTSIGSSAFSGCTGLTSVTIPNSVTSIGQDAFKGCVNLPIIGNCRYADTYLVEVIDNSIATCEIKEGTRFIGNKAFNNCSNLTSVTIPNSVSSIDNNAFKGCTKLNSVKINDIGVWCKIPLNNSSYNNPLLYASHLYLNGEEIKDLVIPNDVTSIGNYTFYGCIELKSVTIPGSVTSIGNSAFYGCSNITSVSIGSGIKTIGANAFAQCPEIKEVYCYAKDVPTISSDTFKDSYYIKWATLYVPESSVDLYKASAWSQFGNIVGITGGNGGDKCEKPIITILANGKFKVESATEGATCVTNIIASNAEPLTDGEISINTPLTVYTVTAYATAEGYDDSEVATATFRYEKTEGDMNGDGTLNIADVIHLVNMILSK